MYNQNFEQMIKKVFFSFRLLLTVGMATVIFNSCGKDDDNPNNPDDHNKPTTVAVTSISLNTTALSLPIGEEYLLIATVMPDSATNKTVTWTSSDSTKVTVVNGKVTTVATGIVTITAKSGDKIATCNIIVWETGIPNDINGIVINGVRWATRNVASPGTFAVKPEDPGMFYQWDRKTAWPATGVVTDWEHSFSIGITWEKANDPSPSGWRVPTSAEIETLLDTDRVSNVWTIVNGVNGRKFTDIFTGNSLFLPAVGGRLNGSGKLIFAGEVGYYWSSTQSDIYIATNIYFFIDDIKLHDIGGRDNGLSVRPVAE
jgi:uncharacterized protein (TIGR02145 family)